MGALTMTIGLSAGPVSGGGLPTQVVPLHNATATAGPDCPDTVNSYWHFVTAPNNGSFSFVSITLDLAGTLTSFSGAQIIPNGSQTDNVFVMVPASNAITDIVQATSFANIAPHTGYVKFVLSHLCNGTGTSTTSTSTSTTSTSTSTSTTSTSTTSTSTTVPVTVPCEWNPQIGSDDPNCTTTTSSTSTTSTTTTTTLPCEWNGELAPDDEGCVPSLAISVICYDIDVEGTIERYWLLLTNNENVAVDVTWDGGSATLRANGSLQISNPTATITLLVDGKPAATTPQTQAEFCQQTVEVTKIVDGPVVGPATYTIQISRLVGDTYLAEGAPFQLVGGQTISIPIPSTFNVPGVNYKIEEIDNGDATLSSVTPDSFLAFGHKDETISVTIANTYAAISLDKQASTSSVQPGDELIYTLVATNTGALTLNPVQIFDRLPAQVIYDDGDYTIVGNAGTCTLVEAARPQLIRCDLPGQLVTGASTPAIELLVTADPNLAADTTIQNQAMAIGTYTDAITNSTLGLDLSCEPTVGQVCDLSAKIGTSVQIPPTTSVASQAPTTTVLTGSAAPTTVVAVLPKTGSDSSRPLSMLGGVLVLLGGVMLLGTRRTLPIG